MYVYNEVFTDFQYFSGYPFDLIFLVQYMFYFITLCTPLINLEGRQLAWGQLVFISALEMHTSTSIYVIKNINISHF